MGYGVWGMGYGLWGMGWLERYNIYTQRNEIEIKEEKINIQLTYEKHYPYIPDDYYTIPLKITVHFACRVYQLQYVYYQSH